MLYANKSDHSFLFSPITLGVLVILILFLVVFFVVIKPGENKSEDDKNKK